MSQSNISETKEQTWRHKQVQYATLHYRVSDLLQIVALFIAAHPMLEAMDREDTNI